MYNNAERNKDHFQPLKHDVNIGRMALLSDFLSAQIFHFIHQTTVILQNLIN